MDMLKQSNVPACCMAALTGLIVRIGYGNVDALCDRAIKIGPRASCRSFSALR